MIFIVFLIIYGIIFLTDLFITRLDNLSRTFYEPNQKELLYNKSTQALDSLVETFYDEDNLEDSELQIVKRIYKKNHYQVFYENEEIISECIICKSSIYSSDDILECPACEGKAHKSELLEWIKIKGYCPKCGLLLKQNNFNYLLI